MPISEEVKKIRGTFFSPTITSRGHYAVYYCETSSGSSWMKCREIFQGHYKNAKDLFLFAIQEEDLVRISSFIEHLERSLILKSLSFFGKTDKNNTIWVQPSEFWAACPMKWNLYSLLLRVSLEYDPEKLNIKQTLLKNPYILQTQLAFDRFMFGFTKFTGEPPIKKNESFAFAVTNGWVKVFSGSNLETVRRYLVAA